MTESGRGGSGADESGRPRRMGGWPCSADDWASRGFHWRDGERLVRFGAGSRQEALQLLRSEGLTPFVLLTTARAAVAVPEVVGAARGVVHVPAGPVPEAATAADAGLAVASEVPESDQPAAALVAVGGGRVIDAGKAVAAARGLPCAALPTTLSGAELSAFHRPLADGRGAAPNRPRLVVSDPALAASQPAPALTASALNAFAHAMEATYAPGAGPVTSAAACQGARLLVRGLEGLRDDEVAGDARSRLALGALLAGYAIGATGLGLHHALSQTVVRHTGAPHAMVNAVLVPHVLRAMLPAAPEALAPIVAALAEDGGGEDPIDRLQRLAAGCGVRRLLELGVGEQELPVIARLAARRPELAATPSKPGEGEALALLRSAW